VNVLDYKPSLRGACLDLFGSNVPLFFAESELPDFEGFLDEIEQGGDRSTGAKYYFVVQLGGRFVACGGFAVAPDGLAARMCWGMVGRAYQKQNIGRDFLLYRIRRIRQLFPYSSVALDTTQHSKGFYEKMGFVVTGITPDYYAPGMDSYDMELRADDIAL
jgi:ribosomal protein S18 acetylase RimI-like enzyme